MLHTVWPYPVSCGCHTPSLSPGQAESDSLRKLKQVRLISLEMTAQIWYMNMLTTAEPALCGRLKPGGPGFVLALAGRRDRDVLDSRRPARRSDPRAETLTLSPWLTRHTDPRHKSQCNKYGEKMSTYRCFSTDLPLDSALWASVL